MSIIFSSVGQITRIWIDGMLLFYLHSLKIILELNGNLFHHIFDCLLRYRNEVLMGRRI